MYRAYCDNVIMVDTRVTSSHIVIRSNGFGLSSNLNARHHKYMEAQQSKLCFSSRTKELTVDCPQKWHYPHIILTNGPAKRNKQLQALSNSQHTKLDSQVPSADVGTC